MKIETSKEPIRLKKKKPKPKWYKKITETLRSSFCVVWVLLGMGSTLECDVDIPSETVGELILRLSVGISYTELLLRGGPLCPLHFPGLGPHLAWTCANLMSAATVSVSSCMCQPCCVWRCCFFGVIHHLWLLRYFYLSSTACLVLKAGFW